MPMPSPRVTRYTTKLTLGKNSRPRTQMTFGIGEVFAAEYVDVGGDHNDDAHRHEVGDEQQPQQFAEPDVCNHRGTPRVTAGPLCSAPAYPILPRVMSMSLPCSRRTSRLPSLLIVSSLNELAPTTLNDNQNFWNDPRRWNRVVNHSSRVDLEQEGHDSHRHVDQGQSLLRGLTPLDPACER